MYNRYIRDDHGAYTRVTEDDGPPPPPDRPGEPGGPPPEPPRPAPPKPGTPGAPGPSRPGPPPAPPHRPGPGNPVPVPPFSLRRLLDGANLEQVEGGDLLLLGLLLLLIREGADEELLVALGLLLIL